MTRSPFSLKGLLIGAAMSLAVGLAAPYGLALEYFRMGFNPSSQGAIFFFLAVHVVNILFSFVRRSFCLSRADLVLVYCMLLVAVTVPTWGLMFFLMGTMVYPYYYATQENQFAELFHDHIPSWMVPRDMQAIMHYYEGLPKGASIEWSVHERLAYPMLQLPNSMIEKGEGAFSAVAPLFRNRVMDRLRHPHDLLQLYRPAPLLSQRPRVPLLVAGDQIVAGHRQFAPRLQLRLDRFFLPRQSGDQLQHLVLLRFLQVRGWHLQHSRHQQR